ncbi:hypothetical protein V8D89_007907, partial [Ganoderma adspersum]
MLVLPQSETDAASAVAVKVIWPETVHKTVRCAVDDAEALWSLTESTSTTTELHLHSVKFDYGSLPFLQPAWELLEPDFWFSTLDANTASATILSAPFPGGLLNVIDPPTPRPSTPLPSDCYTEGQHDLIQHMLWNTAHRESYFEKKREAARVKKTEDRCSKREEYPPHGTAAAVPVVAPNLAAPSVPIAGPLNIAGPSTVLTLPIVTSSSTRHSTTAVPPPPHAPSPMQED